MKQESYIGNSPETFLCAAFQQLQAKRIFLVSGKKSFETCGAAALLQSVFSGLAVCRFSDFAVNPKIEDIKRGIASAKEFKPDLILAVGGGSVIDTAKCISALTDAACPEEAVKKNEVRSVLPLIAMPTTAGTGSEATHFAVVYVDGKKYSLASPMLRPRYAVVVPKLTKVVPYQIRISAGMDALAQCIEAWWNIHSTPESDRYAEKGISLLYSGLKSLKYADDRICADIAEGAYLAGNAINIAKTTAPHAFSYFLTSAYGLPHGQAVSFWLPFFCAFNAEVTEKDCNDPRGPEFVRDRIGLLRKWLGVPPEADLGQFMIDFILSCDLEIRADLLKINLQGIDDAVRNVNLERLRNNPRQPDSDIAVLLKEFIFRKQIRDTAG